MNFLDGSLFPENQDDLVITAAPYGPEWMPKDFPEDIPVTISLGVASIPECVVNDHAAFLAAADKALYEAKRAGRNRVVVAAPGG